MVRAVGGGCRWGLGVLMYVLLTGRQPFSSPKTDDPMVVMRRIVDENWHIKYPPYLSPAAKVRPPAASVLTTLASSSAIPRLSWSAMLSRSHDSRRASRSTFARRNTPTRPHCLIIGVRLFSIIVMAVSAGRGLTAS